MLAGLIAEGPAVAANWTGLYVGGNAGASINDSSYSIHPTGCFANGTCGGVLSNNAQRHVNGSFDSVDFAGGGQIGYDYDFNNGFVVGGVADFDGNTMNERNGVVRGLRAPLTGLLVANEREKMSWFGTVRARLGYAQCNWLTYITGGFAYGNVQSNTSIGFTANGDVYSGSSTNTRPGWTAGAGFAYAFDNNWSAGLEYLFVDLSSFSYTDHGNAVAAALSAPFTATFRTNVTARDNLVRFTLNYKFCL
ncbi:MAG: outer membrane protein [Gammaproteobacteria bacterium]